MVHVVQGLRRGFQHSLGHLRGPSHPRTPTTWFTWCRDSGGVPNLVSVMREGPGIRLELVQAALGCLLGLAQDEPGRIAAHGAGAIPAAIKLLGPKTDRVCRDSTTFHQTLILHLCHSLRYQKDASFLWVRDANVGAPMCRFVIISIAFVRFALS
jgi:hypothetical protein